MVEIFVSFLAAYLFLGCLLGYRISMRFAKSDARSGDPLEGGYLALGQVLVFLLSQACTAWALTAKACAALRSASSVLW